MKMRKKTVVAMDENSDSTVRVNSNVGEKFTVKVGVHHGSVLSCMLLLMLIEALPCLESVGVFYYRKCFIRMI